MLHPLRRISRALRPSPLRAVYDEAYAQALPGTPLDPARGNNVLAFLFDQRLLRRREVVHPRPAGTSDLTRVHSLQYLESLQDDPAVLEAIFGFPLNEFDAARLIALQRVATGGTIAATHLALSGRRTVVHLGGGFHHAGPDRGAGFCIFNDVAVAIRSARARGFSSPVLVIDLDLHQGNGTRAAFADDPSVHTFSIHNQDWDRSPAVATTDIALGGDVGDATYLRALRDALPPVISATRPGLLVYVAGTDPADDDVLGDWHITPAGMLERDQFVMRTIRDELGARVPLVVVLAGGYGYNTWRYTARFLGWLPRGHVVEPPDDIELTVRRFRHAVRASDPAPGSRNEWGLTEEDLLGGEPGGRDRRILGRYTPLGFELLFQQLGVLDRLRALGYPEPFLTVDFGSGLGETVRVFGEEERQNLLVELRVRKDRRLVNDAQVVFVEWLLLQNPRAAFSPKVPRLPGQQHPGLGLLGTIVGLLVLVAEQLGLDGVANVPAHFYLVALGRKHLRFVDPARQAQADALTAVLGERPLAEAQRKLEEGRVVDAATGAPVVWEPAAMVIPVSAGLRERMDGEEYAEAVRVARARLSYRIVGDTGLGPGHTGRS